MNLNVIKETLREAEACNPREAVDLFFHMARAQGIVIQTMNVLRPKIRDMYSSLSGPEKEALEEKVDACLREMPRPDFSTDPETQAGDPPTDPSVG